MGSIQLGALQLKMLLALGAVVSLAGAMLVVASGNHAGDVIAAPTTVETPEALAFDDADTAPDPALEIGDDATWLPTPTIGAVEQDEEADVPTDSLVSSTTQPTEPQGDPPVATSVADADAGPSASSAPAAGPANSVPTSARPTTTPSPTTSQPTTTTKPSTTAPSTTPATSPLATEGRSTVGFSGIAVDNFTNSNVNISQSGQDGSFRTVCTVSHFNFDDAIVFPGQQAATHLHMYFGNLLADFSSTGASLASSGDASCQGGPLNRSAYWVPAVLDGNGDVRPAQYMLTYYKRAGDEDVVPYPNGLQMVAGNAMAMSPQPGREQPIGAGVDYSWTCGSPITVGEHNTGRLIPDCSAGEFLTLSLIFPRCGDGRLASPDNKSHMAYPPRYGAACPASHPIRHPQLTYNIHWNNNDTNTGDWYLSSDDHRANGGMLMPGGTTTHADWIGAWHPDVLDIMTSGCFNADHDCKGGTISPSLRLDSPNVQGFSPTNIYNSGANPTAIPFANFGTGTTYAN